MSEVTESEMEHQQSLDATQINTDKDDLESKLPKTEEETLNRVTEIITTSNLNLSTDQNTTHLTIPKIQTAMLEDNAETRDSSPITRKLDGVCDIEQVVCELCKQSCSTVSLVKCTECITSLCETCIKSHISKDHTLNSKESDNFTPEQLCEPCLFVNKQNKADQRCEECNEVLCETCVISHKAQKITRSHTIGRYLVARTAGIVKLCEPCTYKGLLNIEAHCICKECDELMCGDCSTAHKMQRMARGHTIEAIKDTVQKMCDPCHEKGVQEIAEKFCKVCLECLCLECVSIHRSMKATRDHKVLAIQEAVEEKTEICEPCKGLSKFVTAAYFCTECKEFLCLGCMSHHQQLNATKWHVIVTAEKYQNTTPKTKLQCAVCQEEGKDKEAVALCTDCNPVELMCCECLNHHRVMKATKLHTIETSLETYRQDEPKERTFTNIYSNFNSRATKKSDVDPFQPRKPKAEDIPKADSIHLSWYPPQRVYDTFQYQIRLKNTTPSGKWKFYEEQFNENSVILTHLKSDTEFIFQVRMVSNEEEGPYSEQSDPITTKQSAANRIIGFSHIVPNTEGILTKRKLLLEENKRARHNQAKTRKFHLGDPQNIHCKEKTILLVGATGSGKSTLVDGFINYILGVSWDDPFRFTLVDLEDEEKGILKNQAVSQTQWITTYCINPLDGSRLDYKLNIIDTPGFGDTRGFERDQQIVEQIRHLFSASDETGVVFLDAVCFLIKAPDARLTPAQRYIFNAILSLFGQDIADNINVLITFADGKAPPVLAALKEAQLPHDVFFPFNNSGLYADNLGSTMSSLSPMFWEMGCKSFTAFFDNLKTMQTKSLKQTKEVLTQRHQMEITIENLSPLVSNGLNKLDELREEIRILAQHKTEIEANQNFVYTVTETKQIKKDLPRGRHVTNCLNCNVTCHKDCAIPKDEDKHGCAAMDGNGNCTQCVENCSWTQHANTPYIFEFEQEEKKKTYAEKEEKYRKATGEKMTHEKVVLRMWDELDVVEENILYMMSIVTDCNNILKQIALRPNPLSVKEHIDLLIQGEKQEKRAGFQRRIAVLMEFRKKSNIGEDVNRFRQDLVDTRSHSTFHAKKQTQKQGGKMKKLYGYLFGQ